MHYAEVIVFRKTYPNYQTFTYSVPKELRRRIRKGQVVEVPFGKQIVLGVVLKTMQETTIENTRDIFKIISQTPLLDDNQFQLADLISQYYKTSLGVVIKTIAPSFVSGKIIHQIKYLRGLKKKPKSPKQEKVIAYLKKYQQSFSLKELARRTSVSENLLKQMIEKKLVRATETTYYPDPLFIYEQKNILRKLPVFENLPRLTMLHAPIYLLFDKTGITKDKVYLEQIKKVIDNGKQALLVVPEIKLTPKQIKFYLGFFGDSVSIWHGSLSRSHKMHEWLKIQSGKAKVIIGSRSSLFCPFKKLGLIILDDEHETSYKQEQSPRYHARKIALMLNQLQRVPVILGSSNPSLESYYQTQQEKYRLIKIERNQATRASLIDLTMELRKGHQSIFSDDLLEAMTETLQNKKQVVLFLNRRGSATLVVCRDCGYVATCPRCDIPLVLHTAEQNIFRCHHCFYQAEPPKRCPNCHSMYLNHLGLGTQKIETEITKYFPQAKILRIDKDSASKKSAFLNIYQKFQNHKADILIGTKMIQPFLNLPNVILLGIVNADTLLNLPDFRNQEKTFQLFNQFILNIENKPTPGRTLIQTYTPNNLALNCLVKNNYEKLLNHELQSRMELNYPPFGQLIKLIYTAKKEENCLLASEKLKNNLIRFQNKIGLKDIEIIGPTPAFIPRVNDQYRYHLIIKGKGIRKLLYAVPLTWKIDIDPETLL